MTATIDYPLFDSDNHYYEPRDAFTRFMEPKLAHKAIRPVVDAAGVERVLIGDKPFTFLEHRNYDTVVPPGALREMLRSMKSSSADVRGTSTIVQMPREYVARTERLALLDAQGIGGQPMVTGRLLKGQKTHFGTSVANGRSGVLN